MSDSKGSASVASNSCYISKVSFNSFRRQIVGKTSNGQKDSTYYATYAAHNWVFTINQQTLLIENRDSLPFDTDLSRVLMNLSYNGGVATHRAADAWSEDPWRSYNSADSLDLRKPLHIKLKATDNTERIYTLRINVHTVQGDSLKWNAVASNNALSGAHPMKAVAMKDRVAVLVNDGSAVICMTHGNSNTGEWDRFVTNLPNNTDLNSFVKGNDDVYINSNDGGLFTSKDGLTWAMLDKKEGLRLIGVSDEKLYAIFNGVMNSTPIDSMNWEAEYMDDEPSMLPDEEICILTYPQTKELTRMILVGNRSVQSDTTAVVWSKCWMNFEDENKEGWMHYSRNWVNIRQLPMFTQMNLMYYDNMLLMATGKSVNGSIKALERFYASKDNGLTWNRLQNFMPPSDIHGVDGHITSTVDTENYIWLIAGGKVYRGRLNKLGFDRKDAF